MFTATLSTPTTKIHQFLRSGIALSLALFAAELSIGQSVSEIITDYNGYYKTGTAAVNTVKPDNNHNLLAFSFNGARYSTGVNDALLTSSGDAFTPGDFRALPLNNFNGIPTSNTKIGLGAMADGVFNGAGTAPSRSLGQYLNDGPNGLNLGTCVANLPSGTMFMSVSNLQAGHIGDGVPDILVTQVADPSGRYDRYSFTDIDGNMVGNFMDIVLTNITPVGQWTADFYEATGSAVLGAGFTQTQRNIRMWAADFSAFGINASNISNISYFKIDLSGDSDIGFVAYNTTTVTVQQVLALPEHLQKEEPVRANAREEIKSLKAFPNPATTSVNLEHPQSKSGEEILVYGMNGILLMQQPVASRTTRTTLNISTLRSGAYHVVYSDGINKYSSKLLVK